MASCTTLIGPADYRSMAWKNGGGATTEVLRHPASPDTPFLWRISIAEIRQPGPFSRFEGYDRSILVIDGAGIVLQVDGESVTLDKAAGFYQFSGDQDVQCALIDGPTRDFNLMIDRERMAGTAELLYLGDTTQPIEPPAGATVIVHPLDAVANVETASTAVTVPAGSTLMLEAATALTLSGSGRCVAISLRA